VNGIEIALISQGLNFTPLATLARPVCGIRGNSLIVTLPGSPKACAEGLSIIYPGLSHGLSLVLGDSGNEFHSQMNKESKSQGQHTGCHHHCPKVSSGKLPTTSGVQVAYRARESPYPMLPVKEAENLIREQITKLPNTVIETSITDLKTGSVIAAEVKAQQPVPAYRASVVDGYAVRSSDGPGIYPVLSQSSLAGSQSSLQLLPGHIMRITTGARVPDEADAVVMVEYTKLIEASEDGKVEIKVEILSQMDPGNNIREIGSDISQGSVILKPSSIVSPFGAETVTLSTGGVDKVKIHRRPVVGVMSTGGELVTLDYSGPLRPGQVKDANRPSLLNILSSHQYPIKDLGIVEDNPSTLTDKIYKSLEEVDVLITTGGVSMGEMDLIKEMIQTDPKFQVHFGRIKMKPGKPATFATYHPSPEKTALFFALPGNPVSAIVTFYLLVLPALRQFENHPCPQLPKLKVKLTHSIRLDSRPEYLRAVVTNEISSDGNKLKATSLNVGKTQPSSQTTTLAGANALLELPAKSAELASLAEGDEVVAILINPIQYSQMI
jgi:gephyrin